MLLVDTDDSLGVAAVVVEVEMERRLTSECGRRRGGGDERRPDVGRAEGVGGGESLERGRCAAREIVGTAGRDGDRPQNSLLGRGRASAVVDTEPSGHDDQERTDIPEAELEAEEMGVIRGVAEERGDRAEVAAVVDQGNLDAVPFQEDVLDGLRERCARGRRGRLVGEVDALSEQVVARRVAVGE